MWHEKYNYNFETVMKDCSIPTFFYNKIIKDGKSLLYFANIKNGHEIIKPLHYVPIMLLQHFFLSKYKIKLTCNPNEFCGRSSSYFCFLKVAL